jgi:DNA polymerase III alpha subunit
MQDMDRLRQLCQFALMEQGLEQYQDRLNLELKEIDVQADYEYFLNYYDKKARFAENENNLIVAKLLGLVKEFDPNRPPVFVQGEFPDIDTDFLSEVRDHLKQVWAPKEFGKDNICEIGTYGTLGIKSAILDMTRVHGIPKDEIQAITVGMKDKDDEGEDLTWEKALEIYPPFADYCARYPDVAEAAKALVYRRKSGGRHAGGLIIANCRIADFVPLEVRSVNKDNKNGIVVSAWAEGQATQDLQPVGLIKYDLLVVDDLMQIAQTCKLIKDRHGIHNICALPGQRNWSDTSYLNDPMALALANNADTHCIFQFGSDGIRKLLKQGGVTSFDDIAAYSALYRPGPLGMGMADRYCLRKKGKEQYTLHPLMKPILGYTYGVMVFQEQVMQILHVVGDIPLIHCEKVRKAISKKKVEQFSKYKEMFLRNGQIRLGQSEEEVQALWDQICAFADYGFNKSHSYAYSYISARQLWLMAHYPLEFYCSSLSSQKEHQELKYVKLDANRHNVEVMPININKSKSNFSIQDEKIYFGFSNIKGLGEEAAKEIEAAQPYENFMDFLEKYGTEAKVLKPLISIGSFDDSQDRLQMFKFYEHYKETIRKRRERRKRFEESLVRYQEELDLIVESYCVDPTLKELMKKFDAEGAALCNEHLGTVEIDQEYKYKGETRIRKITAAKLAAEVRSRRECGIKNFEEKELKSDDRPPTLDSFNSTKVKIDEEVVRLMTEDTRLAETLSYGFAWSHILEESPDYNGCTIDGFLKEVADIGTTCGCIEVEIQTCKQKVSKGGAVYYTVEVEDANGQAASVTVWTDDYERFKDDLKKGVLAKMRVKPPFGNFKSFSFESVPKRERWKLPKDREDDCRLVVLRKGEKKKPVDLSDCMSQDAFQIQLGAIDG